MSAIAPSPEAQLQFLSKLQRLFAEGDFTATYKFALLMALADLAIELGADDGHELMLTTRQLGLRFIGLYWSHALPYSSGRAACTAGVLAQNKGSQAAVLTAIEAFRLKTQVSTLLAAIRHPDFDVLLSKVSATVSTQPLTYLQNFGGGTDEFIYTRTGPGQIRLKPGVAYCLRRFYPLLQQLTRTHWVGHIKGNRLNMSLLGEADDLEAFLFAPSRKALGIMATGLRRLDGAQCFYCRDSLTEADVDHYIPFSLYPRDLAHNFVLAHPTCNRSKSDTLAALPHLERWLERIDKHADALAQIGAEAGFMNDLIVSHQVGAWAYTNAATAASQGWLSPRRYQLIDSHYLAHFTPKPSVRSANRETADLDAVANQEP